METFLPLCRVTGKTVLRCLEMYSVPVHIAPYLDLVAGVIRFPSTANHKNKVLDWPLTPLADYDRGLLTAKYAFGVREAVPITPSMIKKLYNITISRPVSGNVQVSRVCCSHQTLLD